MAQVELLWFQDCPSHQATRALVHEVVDTIAPDAQLIDLDATDPAVATAHRFPGSPTVRVDGRDVDPSFVDSGDYTPRCRLYRTPDGLRPVPERSWIEAALRAAIAE